MNPAYAQPGSLLFRWERPRRRKIAIAGFLLASAGLHALCFYLFQIVYPPAISLLPPPAQVTVIAPTSDEARSLLNWIDAEDPALASQTQRPADARAYQLPKLEHLPSYLAVPPQLKAAPARPLLQPSPSAMPPGPVPVGSAPLAAAPLAAPTRFHFSEPFDGQPVTQPELKFRTALREAPQTARFRFAVDSLGAVRYVFLEESSGDAALDAQARAHLALCRFPPGSTGLRWATVSLEFGFDLAGPSTVGERAP